MRKYLNAFLRWLLGSPVNEDVSPADWSRPPNVRPVYFWYCDDGRTVACDTDEIAAVNAANTQSLARGDWPAFAIVYSKPPWATPSRDCPIVYGPCENCGFCTWKDSEGRCRPCEVARSYYPRDAVKARRMSRALSVQQHPEWFGLTDAERKEFMARARKRKTEAAYEDLPNRLRKVIEERRDDDDRCSL
jgi:hypothetical protein